MAFPNIEGEGDFAAKGNYDELIPAQTAAATSAAHELRPGGVYTLACSPLSTGEAITAEIYDWRTDEWIPAMYLGEQIRLIPGFEIVPIQGMTLVIRFIKPITVGEVGLTLSHI